MGRSKTLLILALMTTGVGWGGLGWSKTFLTQLGEDGSLVGRSKILLIFSFGEVGSLVGRFKTLSISV